MKHYSYDEWLQYVKNEINEQEREQYERELPAFDEEARERLHDAQSTRRAMRTVSPSRT